MEDTAAQEVKEEKRPKEAVQVVGVGASAGGLEALQELISHLPKSLENISIVIAQHLSPTYKSMLVQLLSRQTQLAVEEVRNHLPILPNRIYITPPDSEITLNNGYFVLQKPAKASGPKPSIDTFFGSIAENLQNNGVGVILSGTGTDGAHGIQEIKRAGGITIAQEPHTAKYDGMPISAIETGQVDLVLSPDKIGEELKEISQNPRLHLQVEPTENQASSLDQLLQLLSKRTGTDFSNYKPSTICRRLDKRIAELKKNNIHQYLEYVSQHPEELDALFNNILIGVTAFFRDEEAYEALERHLAKILTTKKKGDNIRIWVPGCATGEEAYSIGIILSKLLNNRISEYNIQIFATDIDEKAIMTARRGLYPKESIDSLPQNLLESYILKKGDKYEVIKNIRQFILFSKHDVTSNPPFLKLDLISCRNLLIYFGQNLQKHVIPIFHYALNPDGYLFLGKSETVGQFTDLFSTIEGKFKIFQRKRGSNIHAIRFAAFKPKNYAAVPRKSSGNFGVSTIDYSSLNTAEVSLSDMVKETFYNTFEHPYVVVSDSMDVMEVSGDVRMFLEIKPGTMNASILKMVHDDLQIELRTLLTKAIKESCSLKGELRRVNSFSQNYYVRIHVKPLLYTSPDRGIYVVIFEIFDLEDHFIRRLQLKDSNDEDPRILELEHELAGTREHLQTFVEELETANEELQSLNEELQSSNEELQSSNEELETSNEELQSTNEELRIAYSELKAATEEIEKQSKQVKISESNAKALLNNTLQAFILVNRDYRIIAFNDTAVKLERDLFAQELKVGSSMIDYNLPGELERFHREFRKALDGDFITGEKQVQTLGSREFRWFKYNYTPVWSDDGREVTVISFSMLDITEQKLTELELSSSEQLVNSIFNVADIGICVTNETGQFVKVNQTYCDIYGYSMEEIIGKNFTLVLPEDQRNMAQEMHDQFLEGSPETPGIWEVMRKDGTIFKISVTASRLINDSGQRFKVTTVTPLKEGS